MISSNAVSGPRDEALKGSRITSALPTNRELTGKGVHLPALMRSPANSALALRRDYFASTIRTGLSSWNVSTVSAGTLSEPPLVRI